MDFVEKYNVKLVLLLKYLNKVNYHIIEYNTHYVIYGTFLFRLRLCVKDIFSTRKSQLLNGCSKNDYSSQSFQKNVKKVFNIV